jgi:hypothetical protein
MSSQHLPPINLASLTAEQREKFQICRETLSYHTDVLSYGNSEESATITNMLSMFVCSDYNVNKTLKLAETFRKDKYKIAFSKPTILDAAPFCKAPDDRAEPDSYQCLLENESGAARDIHGRPITLVKGMFYGSFVETTRMVNYMRSRAATHYHKENVRSVLVIFDLTFSPAGSAETTFRFPDPAYREVIKYQESYMLEFMNQSSVVAVVGVPKAMARIMDLTRKAWGYGCTWSFHNDYASLIGSGIVTAENLPVRCGGTFAFDLKEYVSWRAREEGLEREVCNVAARRYTKPGSGGKSKITIGGTDFICDFPETYEMVMSADNKASVLMESVFVGHFKVNDRPSICVMLPWNEFRIHKVSTSNMFGKCEKVIWLSQATKIDTFTDFVWEASTTVVNNGSDSKNSNNTSSNSDPPLLPGGNYDPQYPHPGGNENPHLSARYTITLHNEGEPPITIEQSDIDNSQQAMRGLVDRIDQSLSLDAMTLNDTCLEHLKGTETLELSPIPVNVLESKEHRRGEERREGGTNANYEFSLNQRILSSSSSSSSSQPKTQKKGKRKNSNGKGGKQQKGDHCSTSSDGVRPSDMSYPHATAASSPHDSDGTSWGNVLDFLNLK